MRLVRFVTVLLWTLVALQASDRPSYVREPRTCNAPTAGNECTSSSAGETPAPTPATTTAAAPAGGVYGRVARALAQDAETALLILSRLYELQPGLRESWAYEIARETARWARNTGVRWQLLVAIMWHESRFDPTASSATGDFGLCQLHGKRIFAIGENIRQGAAHFAGCLAAAGGDERHALGHYNGGNYCNTRYAEEVLRLAE